MELFKHDETHDRDVHASKMRISNTKRQIKRMRERVCDHQLIQSTGDPYV